jgi:hypothetical protein
MKRRDLIRMSHDEVAEFLRGRHTMNVATINHDGTIHMVAMWYGFVRKAPAFWTFGKSQKILNLERNPQITCLVEAPVGGSELVVVHEPGAGAVARLDLVEVADVGARQLAGAGPEAHGLGPDPASPPGIELVGAIARIEVGDQATGVRGQLRGPARRLGLGPAGQLGRAVVGIDEPVDVAAEPQPELQVPLDDAGVSHGGRR